MFGANVSFEWGMSVHTQILTRLPLTLCFSCVEGKAEDTGLCFSTAVSPSLFIVKRLKKTYWKGELVCLEGLLQRSRQILNNNACVGGEGWEKKGEKGGVGSDCHCRSVYVPLCGGWSAQLAQWEWYLYVSWVNDRSWEDFYHIWGQYNCNCIMNIPL